jgi:WD40 repeat protein
MKRLVLNMVSQTNNRSVYPLFLREVGKYYWSPAPQYAGSQDHTKLKFSYWIVNKEEYVYKSGVLVTQKFVFDLENKRYICRFQRHAHPILKHGDVRAMCDMDGVIEVRREKARVYLYPSQHQASRCMSFSPSGDSLAVGYDNGGIKIWNTKTGQLIRSVNDTRLSMMMGPPACSSVVSLCFAREDFLAAKFFGDKYVYVIHF